MGNRSQSMLNLDKISVYETCNNWGGAEYIETVEIEHTKVYLARYSPARKYRIEP